MGYFRIKAGMNVLGIEENVAWATPGQFTTSNFPCNEDGSDCGRMDVQYYMDPFLNLAFIRRRLRSYKGR
jgi:cathepsin X